MKTAKQVKVGLTYYVDDRLRTLINEFADKNGASVSDSVAYLVAHQIGRPELSEVPSERYKGILAFDTIEASHVNGTNHGETIRVQMKGYVSSVMRNVLIKNADALDLPLSDYVTKCVAEALKRPDLAAVPKKRLGRPRNS